MTEDKDISLQIIKVHDRHKQHDMTMTKTQMTNDN